MELPRLVELPTGGAAETADLFLPSAFRTSGAQPEWADGHISCQDPFPPVDLFSQMTDCGNNPGCSDL